MQQTRIDKWLWAVRIFKTRSLAGNECKKKHVFINHKLAKSSSSVSENDTVQVKMPGITREFLVTGIIEKRVSAKLAAENKKEITSQEELDKFEVMLNDPFANIVHKGKGRPTKKDRRTLDRLLDEDV